MARRQQVGQGRRRKIRRPGKNEFHDRSGGDAGLLRELGLDAGLLELGQVVDEDLALQMIQFVLDADGQQAVGLDPLRLPIQIQVAHGDALGTLDPVINPGTDRQPSSPTCSPSSATISGLISTSSAFFSSETSMTINCLCTSTWVAARPIPGASYMVSAMSAARRRMPSSIFVIGCATLRRRGSGNRRMGRSAIKSLLEEVITCRI